MRVPCITGAAEHGDVPRAERSAARYETALPGTCCRPDRPSGLRTVAAPTIEDLSTATTSDVRLGIIAGHQVLYIEKAYGGRPLSAFSAAATLPAHATALGKALLAFSPPETVDHVVRQGLRSYPVSTIVAAARLRDALKVTRLQGMAVASGELLPGHCAVAVPVLGPTGEAAAALEVRLRDVPSELAGTLPALMVAARGLSRDLERNTVQIAAAGSVARGTRPAERAVPTGPVTVPGPEARLRRRCDRG